MRTMYVAYVRAGFAVERFAQGFLASSKRRPLRIWVNPMPVNLYTG